MRFRGLGVELEVAGDDVRALDPAAPDLSSMPGARLVLAAAWESHGARSDAVCATVRLPTWVPGLEGAVLDAASAKARSAGRFDALSPGPLARTEEAIEQPFEATSRGTVARGRHVVGFLEEGRALLACTVLCSEPRVEDAKARCDGGSQVRVLAPFVAEPQPGIVVRALLAAAERPRHALVVASLVGLALVAVVLWSRPRPGRPGRWLR